MGRLRRLILTALPKLALSRATRLAVRVPVPGPLRPFVHGTFARLAGAELSEMAGTLRDYRSVAAFFQRPLRAGARPIDAAPLVWPADGRVASAGPIRGGRLPQVKGVEYALRDLVVDADLARRLDGGSQATVYLAPRDYHRIHAPWDAEITGQRHVPGGLYPVNAGATASIPDLFVRNERVVLEARLGDGRSAALVLVAALNVSDTEVTCTVPGPVDKGCEVGRFGLGSTVVALLGPGAPAFAEITEPRAVRYGEAAAPEA